MGLKNLTSAVSHRPSNKKADDCHNRPQALLVQGVGFGKLGFRFGNHEILCALQAARELALRELSKPTPGMSLF